MPFQNTLKKVDHPQNTIIEAPGPQEFPGISHDSESSIWNRPFDSRIGDLDAIGHLINQAPRHRVAAMNNNIRQFIDAMETIAPGSTQVPLQQREVYPPSDHISSDDDYVRVPHTPRPSVIHEHVSEAGPTRSQIKTQLDAAMQFVKDNAVKLRRVRKADILPEVITPLTAGVKGVFDQFSPDDIESFGVILQSEGYFWISKAIEAAFATPAQYVFILNSIIVRYAKQIFSKDGPISKFSEMITTGFEKLTAVIGGYFKRPENAEQSGYAPCDMPHPGEFIFQGDMDEASGFFSRFTSQLSHLLKYMTQQNVLADLIRIIAIALLGSFTFIFGDREAFSWANVEQIVKRAMKACGDGTIGSFIRVLSTMYGVFRDYLCGTSTSDFTEFMRNNTQQNAMIELCISLKARIAAWGGLTVEKQSETMADWVVFEHYCDATLGRARGWASGRRILDPKTLLSFQTNYYVFQQWAAAVNLGSLRKQPFCLAFIGPSSLGKTTLMDMVNQLILGHLGVDDFPAAIFNVTAEGDHLDGATNGKRSFVMDDIGTKHPTLSTSQGGDPQLSILIRLLNNIPYFPVMAALEDKGVVCCTPDIVQISSNLPTLGIEHTYVNPTIIERRIKYWVSVKVRPEFANAGGALSPEKMRAWSIANPGKSADAWELSVVIKTAGVNAENKMHTINKVLAPMSTSAFLKFILEEYIKHDALQVSVLAQAGTRYDFDHIKKYGDTKVDPSLNTTYAQPEIQEPDFVEEFIDDHAPDDKDDFAGEQAFRGKGQRKSPSIGRRVRKRALWEQQCGSDYLDHEIAYRCEPVSGYGRSWLPIYAVCGAIIGYLCTRNWSTYYDVAYHNVASTIRAIEMAGFVTNRYSRAMQWVNAGLDAMAKLARLVAPFVAAATAAAGVYYFTKMMSSANKGELVMQGGGEKRKSPTQPTYDDVLLLSTVLQPERRSEISYEPGVVPISYAKETLVNHGMTHVLPPGMPHAKPFDMLLPQPIQKDMARKTMARISNSEVDPDTGKKKVLQMGSWIPHPNDAVTSYADGQPQYKVIPHPPGILSQQSLSVKGFDLPRFVVANLVDIVFRSKGFNELGVIGDIAGVESTSTMTFKGKALFYRGKELVTSEHYLPFMHPERATKSLWDADWTLTIVGSSDTGGNVVMPASEVLRNMIRLPGKDAVRILVSKARSYKNIVPYFVRKSVPSNVARVPEVASAMQDSGTEQARLHGLVGMYEYLPQALPVSLCTPDAMTPIGMVTETSIDKLDAPVKGQYPFMVHSRVYLDVDTFQGFCGLPYLSSDNGIYKAIVGIHTGVVRANSKIKLVTPLSQEDFYSTAFGPIEPLANPISVPKGGTLQDAIDTRCSNILDAKWNGPQVLKDYYVQHMPPVKPTPWAKRNEQWIKEETGYVVNPDSYTVLGARDGISGNLASEYRESPVKDAYANADWTGLPMPLISDKCVPNINRSKRNQAAAQNLGQIMAQMSYNEDLADELIEAADCYLNQILEHDGDNYITKHLHEYTMQVAINGHRMDNGNVSKATTPIAMNTSAGLPFSESAPNSNKVPWFIIDADGNRHMGEELSEAFETLRGLMATAGENDPKPKVIFKVALKDEILAEAKLEAGKIRFILVCPVHATILTRKMLLCLCRAMALNPFVFGACVGVDATSAQWKQLYEFLTGHGQLTFDGDYQGFDKALIEEITRAIKYVIMKLLIKSGNYDAESLNLVNNLLSALLAPIVDVFGILYFFRSLNSSGNPLTTQFNCIANMILIWLAFLRRIKRNTGDRFDLARAQELFKAIIRAITYGDDNVISVMYSGVFSCSIMAEELKDIIRYTDAQKGAVTRDFTPHSELVFLGRRLSGGPPTLEFKRIVKMLTHYRKLRGLDFAGVVAPIYRNVLMETYFHGRAVFDKLWKIIVDVLSAEFNVPPTVIVQVYLSNADGPLDYEFFDQWYQAKADTDAVCDPRYEESKTITPRDRAAIAWYEEIVGHKLD